MTTSDWEVVLSRQAEKELARLDPPVRRRVQAALRKLARGDENVDVRGLANRDGLRLRVGGLRVLFRRDSQQRLILVQRVLPRGRAYDR